MSFTSNVLLLSLLALLSACIAENGTIIVSTKHRNYYSGPAIPQNILSFEILGPYSKPTGGFVANSVAAEGGADGVFYDPSSLAIDSINNFIYVADAGNSRVQKFTLAGIPMGSIGWMHESGTCIEGKQDGWCVGGIPRAGNGNGGFHFIKAVKLFVAQDLMFVADIFSIQKFQLSTGAFIGAIGNSTASGNCLAGAQSGWCSGGSFSSGSADGMFKNAAGLDINIADNFFLVADSENFRIQKFNLTTGAFMGAIGYSTASGTCSAGKQSSWCTGGVFSALSADGAFEKATNVAIDKASNVFIVVDDSSSSVSRFNLTTGAYIGTIGHAPSAAGTCVSGMQSGWCVGGSFDWSSARGVFWMPRGIGIDSANNYLFISEYAGARIQKFNLTTGAFIGAIGASNTNSGNCVVGRQNGWCSGSANFIWSDIDGGIDYGTADLAVDTTNNHIYLVDPGNHRVQKFILSTGAFNATLNGVVNLAVGWSTNAASGTRISAAANYNSVASDSTMALDEENDFLYVSASNTIQKFNLTTGAIIGAIGRSNAAGTCVAGKQNSWCAGGTFSSGTGDGEFADSPKIVVDLEHDFLYALNTTKIQKFILSSGAFVGAIGSSTASGSCVNGAQSSWCAGGVFSSGSGDGMFFNARALTIDSDNQILYVADYSNNRIQKINASTGAFMGAIGFSTATGTCSAGAQNNWCSGGSFSFSTVDGGLGNATSLVADVFNNHLYVADRYRVQKFNLTTGSFIGAIGNSTATGTCASGSQATWCTGGTFSIGDMDGQFGFNVALGIDVENNFLYVGGSYRLQKLDLATGEFIGAIGSSTGTGTCRAGVQLDWCVGGVFNYGIVEGSFGLITNIEVTDSYMYILGGGGILRVQESLH